MDDQEFPALLRTLRGPTFFTRDRRLYRHHLRDARYAFVVLDVGEEDVARYVRRVLSHPELDTRRKRMGKVILAGSEGLRVWSLRATAEWSLKWHDE